MNADKIYWRDEIIGPQIEELCWEDSYLELHWDKFRKQRAALDELTRLSQEMGLYD